MNHKSLIEVIVPIGRLIQSSQIRHWVVLQLALLPNRLQTLKALNFELHGLEGPALPSNLAYQIWLEFLIER